MPRYQLDGLGTATARLGVVLNIPPTWDWTIPAQLEVFPEGMITGGVWSSGWGGYAVTDMLYLQGAKNYRYAAGIVFRHLYDEIASRSSGYSVYKDVVFWLDPGYDWQNKARSRPLFSNSLEDDLDLRKLRVAQSPLLTDNQKTKILETLESGWGHNRSAAAALKEKLEVVATVFGVSWNSLTPTFVANRLSSLNTTIAQLQNQLVAAQGIAALVPGLQSQLEQSQADLAAAQQIAQQIPGLQAQVNTLQAQLTTIQDEASKVPDLEAEIQRLRVALTDAERAVSAAQAIAGQLPELQAQITTIRAQLIEAQAYAELVPELNAEIQGLEADLTATQTDLATAQVEAARIPELQDQLQAARGQAQQTQAAIDQLRGEVEALREESATIKTHQDELLLVFADIRNAIGASHYIPPAGIPRAVADRITQMTTAERAAIFWRLIEILGLPEDSTEDQVFARISGAIEDLDAARTLATEAGITLAEKDRRIQELEVALDLAQAPTPEVAASPRTTGGVGVLALAAGGLWLALQGSQN